MVRLMKDMHSLPLHIWVPPYGWVWRRTIDCDL